MANTKDFTHLSNGVEQWNVWRKKNTNSVIDLSEANLVDANLNGANLSGVNLGGAILSKADLRGANLRGAKLGWANLTGADLSRTDLSEADLGGADLRSAKLCSARLIKTHLGGANLSEANLSEANLADANLSSAKLDGTDLNRAALAGADLSGAGLTRAKLASANMTGANFNRTDLTKADLTGADLSGAKLNCPKLDEANFEIVVLGGTMFADTDLSQVCGLDLCTHIGPSTIGLDTFFRSHGEIPETFLRDCGVPQQFITYAQSLVGKPIEFYSCFISYSSQDRAFAERLNADLRAKNLRCWFAPEDLKIGERFHETIDESIRLFDKVMIVLSAASVQSRWVEREVNAAYEREDRDHRTVLFPIRIDDTVMNAPQPWAADIRRSRHIGDFRGWETHSTYVKAFERLLRDLKANTPTPED